MSGLISIASLGLNVLVLIVSVAGFLKIMKNDLVHLTKSVDEVKQSVDCIDKKIFSFAERVSTIEGKCSVNHPD